MESGELVFLHADDECEDPICTSVGKKGWGACAECVNKKFLPDEGDALVAKVDAGVVHPIKMAPLVPVSTKTKGAHNIPNKQTTE